MKIHWIQHVPFEGLGSLEENLTARKHRLSCTRLYAGEPFPEIADIDALIVMGGPMGVHDRKKHPWLESELFFIQKCIVRHKAVLGICLGAQLIALSLGAEVKAGKVREIGWFPIVRRPESFGKASLKDLPEKLRAFHWHGDFFDIPEGATPLYGSEACGNQAFLFGERTLALQFHLETTPASALALLENCAEELDGSKYVQDAERILTKNEDFQELNTRLRSFLDLLFG